MRKNLSAFIFSFLIGMPALAGEFEKIKSLSLEEGWEAVAWQPKFAALKDIPDASAKICFVKKSKNKEFCTEISSSAKNEKWFYNYQFVKELEVVNLSLGSIVKFSAQYLGNGSGYLSQTSFWRFEKSQDAFVSLGAITLSEQGEYIIDNDLLITADAVAMAGETHFSDHKFYVEVYRLGSGVDKMLGFLTTKKYPSLDNAEKIDVIAKEKARIKQILDFLSMP